MKLSEIKQLLQRENIRLTKSLGQNFLHDQNQLRRIMNAAEVLPSDRVLEIGPGLGPLTELLLGRAEEVLAIEKDLRLGEQLEKRLGPNPRLRLVLADALDYLRGTTQNWREWKVVSNLPYSVASPILVELSRIDTAPRRLVVTLQLEVARRLAAAAGTEDYGVLSLLVQVCHQPADLFKIPASCFFPEPEIDSGCVTLVRRDPPLLGEAEQMTFGRVVKQSFAQRRKMMLKLLRAHWPELELEQAMAAVNLDRTIRAEEVSLHQFVALARLLHAHTRTQNR